MDAILTRLNSLVMVLKTCKDRTCTHPWEVLHPDGSIQSLAEALNSQYDEFYSGQPVMWFSDCPRGYLLTGENQDPVSVFSNVEL